MTCRLHNDDRMKSNEGFSISQKLGLHDQVSSQCRSIKLDTRTRRYSVFWSTYLNHKVNIKETILQPFNLLYSTVKTYMYDPDFFFKKSQIKIPHFFPAPQKLFLLIFYLRILLHTGTPFSRESIEIICVAHEKNVEFLSVIFWNTFIRYFREVSIIFMLALHGVSDFIDPFW